MYMAAYLILLYVLCDEAPSSAIYELGSLLAENDASMDIAQLGRDASGKSSSRIAKKASS